MNAVQSIFSGCGNVAAAISPTRFRILPFVFLGVLNTLPAQKAFEAGQFTPGTREIFAIDFSREPIGAPPAALQVLNGSLEVAVKDGAHMLRANSSSEFIVSFNERLPEHFTLEFDVVSRMLATASGEELAFEGSPIMLRNGGSAQILWNHVTCNIQGGGVSGGDMWCYVPDELSSDWMGQLAHVQVDIDGTHFRMLTNGRILYDLPTLRFVRGRMLRIFLGGQDNKDLAVHLARLRVAAFGSAAPGTAQQQSALTSTSTSDPRLQQPTSTASSPTLQQPTSTTGGSGATTESNPADHPGITGITVTVNAAGFASVTWNPLTVAATYFVMRWKPDDPLCCYNVSPPGMPLTSASWQDGQLPTQGTYRYRVIATTANGLIAGETQYSYSGATAMPPPGVPTTSSIVNVASPTIAPAPIDRTILTAPIDSSAPTTTANAPTTITAVTATTPTTGTVTPMTAVTTIAPPAAAATTTTVAPAPTTVTAMPVSGITGSATGMVMTAPATQSSTSTSGSSNPADTSTTQNGGPGMPAQPPTYRVMVTGFAAIKLTDDDPLQLDGHGDEVFVAAAVISWNRQSNQLTNFAFVQTREFGETGNTTLYPDRIKGGSATMNGGIAAGDRVPNSYDLAGSNLPAPTTDQLPLLVWQGPLTAGVDAIVIAPSLWERDVVRTQFAAYKSNWSKTSPSAVLASPTVSQLLADGTVTSALAPIAGTTFAAPPALTFSGPVAGGYKLPIQVLGPNLDRPIGMRSGGLGVLIYEERFTVLTQEKVASLAPGQGITLALPVAEPIDLFLKGMYTLYLRVERIQ